ncbi:unnamed protein product, partial [Ectocarpus sp. 12 AP-2014]
GGVILYKGPDPARGLGLVRLTQRLHPGKAGVGSTLHKGANPAQGLGLVPLAQRIYPGRVGVWVRDDKGLGPCPTRGKVLTSAGVETPHQRVNKAFFSWSGNPLFFHPLAPNT